MTNWNERAEQERRRLAADKASRQQPAGNEAINNAPIKQTKESVRKEINAKLELFDALGVPKQLEEIRRDIWKVEGTVRAPRINTDADTSGTISTALETRINTVSGPLTEIATRIVDGPYTVSYTPEGPSGWVGDTSYIQKSGRHNVGIGIRLRGGDPYVMEFLLSSGLSYGISSDRYRLWVWDKSTTFDGASIDLDALKKFVDDSLLEYAVQPNGVQLAKNLAQRRMAFTNQHRGEIIQRGQDPQKDPWKEWMLQEDLIPPIHWNQYTPYNYVGNHQYVQKDGIIFT